MESATQQQIESAHPPEWVQHQKQTEEWITSTLNKFNEIAEDKLSPDDRDMVLNDLADHIEENPAPLAPIYR